ncbi:MAG: CPBP family intramembrane glutamic endopeptidase [Spirochaetia bacterium]|jgi:hypothetical protein
MGWLEAPAKAVLSFFTDPYAALFCALGVSFMLLSSVLNIRTLKKRRAPDDFTPVMMYFGSFFLLLFILPLAIILLTGRSAGIFPWSVGLQLGNWKLGLILAAVILPISLAGVFVGTRDPAIREYYPFSKQAMATPGRFVLYESAYLVFYYLSWEFTFRGVLLFCMLALLPHTIQGIVVAIMVQTFLSIVYHIGHPSSEVVGAFLSGILAGIVTAATGSFLYALFHHALVGILNDYLMYRGLSRRRRLGRETA